MSKKIKLAKHTPAEIFDMLEDLQLSLEILEEKMDNIYDIVKSKHHKEIMVIQTMMNMMRMVNMMTMMMKKMTKKILILIGMIGMTTLKENKF